MNIFSRNNKNKFTAKIIFIKLKIHQGDEVNTAFCEDNDK